MLVLPSPRRISGAALWSALPTIALWFAVLILLSSQEAVAQDTAPTQARAEASAEAPQTAIGQGPMVNPTQTFAGGSRSEEHTSELQSLMRIPYAVFCLKNTIITNLTTI